MTKVKGWKLNSSAREMLIERFPPRWPDVIADHVTFNGDTAPDTPLPTESCGQVVGEVDDGAGLQALVVEIGGTTRRPDGSTYHITWSIDAARGRKAADSNKVLAEGGWKALDRPIAIVLIPARF